MMALFVGKINVCSEASACKTAMVKSDQAVLRVVCDQPLKCRCRELIVGGKQGVRLCIFLAKCRIFRRTGHCLESLDALVLALKVQNSRRAQQEARCLFRDVRTYAIFRADVLVCAFQSGRSVYRVSNGCVVEEPISPEVADDCRPAVNTYAGGAE